MTIEWLQGNESADSLKVYQECGGDCKYFIKTLHKFEENESKVYVAQLNNLFLKYASTSKYKILGVIKVYLMLNISMDIRYTTNISGTLQPPGFYNPSHLVSHRMLYTLTSPKPYKTLISVARFDPVCSQFCYLQTITISGKNQKDIVISQSGHKSKSIYIIDSNKVHMFYLLHRMRFAYKRDIQKIFQLRFSFNLPQHVPQRILDDPEIFECSKENWKYFRDHFRCNLLLQCKGFEDEVDCPYTNHECRGGISIRNRCFVIIPEAQVKFQCSYSL